MMSSEQSVFPAAGPPTAIQRVLGVHEPDAQRSWRRRLLVALLLSAIGGYLPVLLGPLTERSIYMVPLMAILASALYGGIAGGLLTTVVAGAISSYFMLPPLHSLHVRAASDLVRLCIFLAVGALVSALCDTLRRAIAELREREVALRESAESYRTLFHSLTELVYILDLEGRILDVNHPVLQAYGYTREELLGRSPLELADPERVDLASVHAAVRLATTGRAQCLEIWGRRRDGSCFPKEITLTRGRYFGREVLIVVARDITARKTAETALARSEEELRQAQKMEAIGRLAGGVAHDFNNLLTAIRGNAELAANDLPVGSPVHADLLEISATADRAAALTRQLLAFSRKQVRQLRLLDLNVVLLELERMLRRVIGADVELVTHSATASAWVLADAAQMEQVILNLVVNARDALPRGGRVRIELTDGLLPAGGPAVILSVRDNGTGIPADVIDHIFEPFFTTKAQGKGTGLGLSTVYGIVQQSGGEITVDSVPGAGTCFRVALPMMQSRSAETPRLQTRAARTGAGTILLVEDDTEVRSLTERLLRRAGYHVHSAACGPDAVNLVREHSVRPELLLTDVLMPDMSGPELAARLRQELPALPVLFVSGYSPDTASYSDVLAPGAALLQKPFTADALLEHVAARLSALPA